MRERGVEGRREGEREGERGGGKERGGERGGGMGRGRERGVEGRREGERDGERGEGWGGGRREGGRERIEQYTPQAAGISCKLCTVIRPGTEIFNDAYTCTCTWQVKMRKLLL